MKRFLITCSIVLATINIQAQTKDAKWNIAMVEGITQYKGSLGNTFYKFNTSLNWISGASVTRYITDRIDVNVLAARGGLGINEGNTRFTNYFTTAIVSMRVHILNRNSIVRPYIMVGAGTLFYDKNSNVRSDVINIIAPSYGGGMDISLGSSVRLNLQEAFHHTSKDKIDFDVPDEKATFLFHTVSISVDIPNRTSRK